MHEDDFALLSTFLEQVSNDMLLDLFIMVGSASSAPQSSRTSDSRRCRIVSYVRDEIEDRINLNKNNKPGGI